MNSLWLALILALFGIKWPNLVLNPEKTNKSTNQPIDLLMNLSYRGLLIAVFCNVSHSWCPDHFYYLFYF